MGQSWEPGPPSARSMAPGAVGGAIIPLAVYFVVRSHVHGDAPALMIAGIPAALWVMVEWIRRRRLDPIGTIVLVGFVAGVIVSLAMGGSSFVLKVRDSAFTATFGLVSLASLARRRPLMFFIGRALSAGDDPVKIAAYDELWAAPVARRAFRIITVAWGVGLIADAAARVLLAMVLSTGAFVVAAPALGTTVIGGLFVFTFWFSKRARRIGERDLAGSGVPARV